MTKKFIKFLIFLVIMILLFSGVSTFLLMSPIIKNDIYVSIPKNASTSQIVKAMNKQGLCEPALLFLIYIKFYSYTLNEKVHAGTYRFNDQNKMIDVLRAIFSGKQLAIIKVTFPEGITLKQFASICTKKLGTDSAMFLRIANSDSIRREYGIKFKTAEGYFYPATYTFFWKADLNEVIRTLLDYSQKHWEEKFEKAAADLGKSRHQILTLASIVEAETPTIGERKRVAGVYSNRLKRGKKLEADPTVQYGIGEKKKLTFKDLEYDSPYNTYRYTGLPPGPINSPSLTSIEAALNPENHDYIYFVAVGDGSGTHNFARSFSQHEQNKSAYKRNRKANQ